MKKFKFLLIFPLLLSLFCALAIPAAAKAERKEGEFATFSGDGVESIEKDGVVYTRYTIPAGTVANVRARYRFMNGLDVDGGRNVFTSYCGQDAALFLTDPEYYSKVTSYDYYATAELETYYESFFARETDGTYFVTDFGNVHQEEYLRNAELEGDLFGSFSSASAGIDFTVAELRQMKTLLLYCYDDTGCFCRFEGCLFSDGEETYYLAFSSLPTSLTDADGKLSFRNGAASVSVAQVGDAEVFSSLSGKVEFSDGYVYERYEEFDFGGDEEDVDVVVGKVIYWVLHVLFGFLLPLLPLVFGIVNLANPRYKNRKGYLVTVVSSAVWIILSIVMIPILL